LLIIIISIEHKLIELLNKGSAILEQALYIGLAI
jgi:hypothetical protein